MLNLSVVATKFTDSAAEGSGSITSFLTQDRSVITQTQALGLMSSTPKPPKPSIKSFFSKMGSTSKDVDAEDMTTTTESVCPNFTESVVSPKKSFFQSYIDKQNTESSKGCKITSEISNSESTAESLPGATNVTISENVTGPDENCPNNTTDEECYDADTDIECLDDETNDECEQSGYLNKAETSHASEETDHTVTNDSVSSEDMMICDECGKPVVVWEFPEHTDFHFALKLQQQVKQEQQPLTLQNLDRPSPVKRKSATPSTSRGRKKAKLNMKTLDKFFK